MVFLFGDSFGYHKVRGIPSSQAYKSSSLVHSAQWTRMIPNSAYTMLVRFATARFCLRSLRINLIAPLSLQFRGYTPICVTKHLCDEKATQKGKWRRSRTPALLACSLQAMFLGHHSHAPCGQGRWTEGLKAIHTAQ